MFKENSLRRLINMGLNVHKYSMISTYEELLEYQKTNSDFSIRFDSDTPRNDLPFYTFDNDHYDDGIKCYETGKSMVSLAQSMGCKLLCADGRKYDKVQICNYVYRLDSWNDFVLEISFKNQPLRRMYDGNTVIVRGNVMSSDFDIISNRKQRHFMSRSLLNVILNDMYENSILNKWCECTLYPEQVGVLSRKVIYWQVI